MKSFVRSQNPSPTVRHANRAVKRDYLRHRLAWQPIEDADRAHAAIDILSDIEPEEDAS